MQCIDLAFHGNRKQRNAISMDCINYSIQILAIPFIVIILLSSEAICIVMYALGYTLSVHFTFLHIQCVQLAFQSRNCSLSCVHYMSVGWEARIRCIGFWHNIYTI